jgi:hypothetical protein
MNRHRTFVAIFALSACAPDAATRQISQPVLGGIVDTSHTGVVFVFRDDPPDGCTGFLIAPDLVMTARHCVALSTPVMRCDDVAPSTTQTPWPARVFFVTTEVSMLDRSRTTAVSEVLTPVGAGAPECGNDVALLRLARPISTTQIYEPRLDRAPQAGESIVVSGYGFAVGSSTDAGVNDGPGVRRMRAGSRVQSVGTNDLGSGLRASSSDWVVDVGPCRGDSGSPAFDGAGRVLGVLSRGYRNVCAPMIYNRLDVHAGWLRAEASRSYARAMRSPPAWVSPMGDGGIVDGGMNPPGPEYVCSATPSNGSLSRTTSAAVMAMALLFSLRRRVRQSGVSTG